MKNNKNIVAIFAAAVLLTGCAQTEFDAMSADKLMGVKLETTYTIAKLKTDFMVSTALFSADSIVSTKDIVINGIVTSSDNEGNVYKYIVVQEEGANAQAMKISIDAGSLSGIYPLGQRVSVRCNGLYIGKYAEGPQMGVYYENKTKTPVRIEPGRMPKYYADTHISAYGLPVPAAVIPDTMTIAQIKAGGISVANKLVCIKNAFFTGKGANYGLPSTIPETEQIFAPSTNGIGYPQSREIQDGSGASVFVSTSEYSKFASKRIPAPTYKGNITAIIGWYNDRDATASATKIYHQLTLRSISDLGKGFETYHLSIK